MRRCLDTMAEKVRDLERAHGVLDENMKRLHGIAVDLGIEIFGGKGLGANVGYEDRTVRDFNDIDLFVRTCADGWRVSRILREEFGYVYQDNELPWFKYDEDEDLLYGQINLVAPAGSPDFLNVDIHFGDYSVRHCARLGLTDTLPFSPPGLHIVAPEENLACIVNNAAGDYFVTAKDTNDLLTALSRPSFAADRLTARLRRAHLQGFFGYLVTTLRASSALTAQQETALLALRPARTLEPSPLPDRPDWSRRCIGTTVHAFSTGRARGLLPAVRLAADAFSYYRRRLTLSVVQPEHETSIRPVSFNPWTCVRLVPVDLARSLLPDDVSSPPSAPAAAGAGAGVRMAEDPDIERFDTASGSYLRVGEEFFVATVSYELSRGVIARVVAAAAS
ncbi:hypothetical protein [Streptomyces sp. NPDC127098]|uniref:hypothetical protein n=1 Tax=Streptomyces sp. NPDC127098 TaxID=3347137 RepID=UPI00364F67F8